MVLTGELRLVLRKPPKNWFFHSARWRAIAVQADPHGQVFFGPHISLPGLATGSTHFLPFGFRTSLTLQSPISTQTSLGDV